MSNIYLKLNGDVIRGKQVSFYAPLASESTEYLVINDETYVFVDANNHVVHNAAGLWAAESIVSVILDNDTDPKRAYIQNPAGGRVGRKVAGGGEIFGDYATNQATAEFATAFGSYSGAFAPGSFAAGHRISKLDADITYDENGRQVPVNEEDWRYNEAYGYGAEAFGKGAVAYSRASKSFGYRTQTGYPPSPKIAALRPEAVLCPLPFDLTNPSGGNYDAVSMDENSIVFQNDGGSVVYSTTISGWLKFAVDANMSDEYDNFCQLWITSLDSKGAEIDTVYRELWNKYLQGRAVWIEVQIPKGTESIKFECRESEGLGSLIVELSRFQYYPRDNKGQGAFAIGADTAALGNHAFAGGWGSIARGYHSFAFGGHNEAYGEYSVAFGNNTKATGYAAMAIGDYCESSAENTFAGGFESKASSGNSIAFGYGCIASTRRTVALGSEANASGEMGATAIGHQVTAIGKGATAMGSGTYAKGEGTFAIGAGTKATLYGASAFGDKCIASNYNALAGGASSVASHANSFAFGRGVATSRSSQFVIGQDNAEAKGALFVVGNGTRDTNGNITSQTNAFVVEATGNATLQGGLNGVYMHTWKNNSNTHYIKTKFNQWSSSNTSDIQLVSIFSMSNHSTLGTNNNVPIQYTIAVDGKGNVALSGSDKVTVESLSNGFIKIVYETPMTTYITAISAENFYFSTSGI